MYLTKHEVADALKAYLDGDVGPIGEVARLMGRGLCQYVNRYKHVIEEDEVVQECAVALMTKAGSFNPNFPRANAFSYMTAVCLNQLRATFREKKRQAAILDGYFSMLREKGSLPGVETCRDTSR